MNSAPHAPCPAEVHDARVATDGLLLLYRGRDECALVHGCARDSCPLEREWPGRWDAAAKTAGWRLFAFIALAFAGPRNLH